MKKNCRLVLIFVIAACLFLFGCNTPNAVNKDVLIEMNNGDELFINIGDADTKGWESDDENVVSIVHASAGFIKLTAVSEGTAVVKSVSNGKILNEYRIHVKGVAGNDFSFANGQTLSINLTENEYCQVELTDVDGERLKADYTFEIEDIKRASVSEAGLIRGIKPGVTALIVTEKKSGIQKRANIIVSGSRAANYQSLLDTGIASKNGHIQGFTADSYGDYFYLTFTDSLIKMSSDGEIVGSVIGFGGSGHLGDVAFNEEDGRVYAGFTANIAYGIQPDAVRTARNCFVMIFDVDKIDAMNMSANGIVTSIYVGNPVMNLAKTQGYGAHGDAVQLGGKYGVINQIDSTTFGPKFGEPDGEKYLTLGIGMIAAGAAYNGLTAKMRTDNDYVTIVQYDMDEIKQYEVPYSSYATAEGPENFTNVFHYYMGYHDYGIQNIMYDDYTEAYYLTAYGISNNAGDVQFPDYVLYVLDAATAATEKALIGNNPDEKCFVVTEKCGVPHSATGIKGYKVWADVGIHAMGDGYFYIATSINTSGVGYSAKLTLYKWNLNASNADTATSPFITA